MKKVIITGPTGAIGIALIEKFIQQKVNVLAVCRKGSKRINRIPVSKYVKVLECNLDSLHELPKMVKEQYDVFYHFAWDGTIGDSRNNMCVQVNNIKYTLDAVDVAAAMGCKRFVGAGSQAEYGRVEGVLNSNTSTFPENGYGMAKLCAGQMSRVASEQKGIEHIWTRILSIYGPCDGDNTMIMSTIIKLESQEIPLLTKGEQQWDYLYSRDAAEAFSLLGECGIHGKIYCIGGGKTRLLRSYMNSLWQIGAYTTKLGIGEREYFPKQVMYLCADISELTKDTGFVPQYTFEEGIRETIEWYRSTMKREEYSYNETKSI